MGRVGSHIVADGVQGNCDATNVPPPVSVSTPCVEAAPGQAGALAAGAACAAHYRFIPPLVRLVADEL